MPEVVVRDPLSIYYTAPDEAISGGRVLSSLLPEENPITFLINPTKLEVRLSKKEKYVLTKAGWERHFFNNDVVLYTYSGTTGAFRPDELDSKTLLNIRNGVDFISAATPDVETFDITTTRKWIKFKKIRDFFEKTKDGVMALVWWSEEKAAVGSMNDFGFTQNADDPFQILYNFKYTGVPVDLPKVETYFKDMKLKKRT